MTSLIYRISLVLVCLFTFIILPLTSAKADTYTVTVFYDDYDINLGDGICADSTGACTLRAAVDESNFIIGADIIYLPNPGTYSVTQTVLSVTDRLTIQGTSKRNTVIEGDPSFGLFVVNGKLVTANFNNLTMTNANRAIYSSYGTVNVNDCLLYKNTGQNGAAIKTYYGNLIINNSSLIYNTAISTGGALYISHSVVSINNSDLSYNTS